KRIAAGSPKSSVSARLLAVVLVDMEQELVFSDLGLFGLNDRFVGSAVPVGDNRLEVSPSAAIFDDMSMPTPAAGLPRFVSRTWVVTPVISNLLRFHTFFPIASPIACSLS